MHKIIRADRRHRLAITKLLKRARIGNLGKNEPIRNCWIVRNSAGKIIACCAMDFYNNSAILTSLAVEKEFRHRGIGANLIKHRIKIAKQKGVKLIGLVTMYYHFNFYKRRGFKTCPRAKLPETIKNYYQFTRQRYKKCAVMLKRINPA